MGSTGSIPPGDVLIVGGGPAGAALAIALKRAGVAGVVMIDRPARRPIQVGETAAPSLGPLLRCMGLDDRLEARGHLRCHGNLSSWGSPSPAVEDFLYRPTGPGWHLDRPAFDNWLRAEAVSAGARLLSPARLIKADWTGKGWNAQIETADAIHDLAARWIVDASGRPAAFARRQGARLRPYDRLLAYAAVVEATRPPAYSRFSVIEACEAGWWYCASLPGGKSMIALMTDPDIAEEADFASPSNFWRQWAGTALISRHGTPLDQTAPPVIFSASSQLLDRASGPGWIAIGDALMALDPLSASGLTGSLDDALAAAAIIAASAARDEDDGVAPLLSSYAARAEATFQRFLAERAAIYDQERRWATSPFWARRVNGADAQG